MFGLLLRRRANNCMQHLQPQVAKIEDARIKAEHLQPAQATLATPGASVVTSVLEAKPPKAIVFLGGEVEEEAPLEKGDDGFLVAKFPSGLEHSFSNLPNLVLGLLGKKPTKGAAKVKEPKKKPAAAQKKPAAVPAAPPVMGAHAAPPVVGAEEKDYGIMYYKRNSTIGIRAKFGACNQVLGFGGVRCKLTKAAMKKIGEEVVKMLHNGFSYEDAKAEGQKRACPA